jgi:hypothetical protein
MARCALIAAGFLASATAADHQVLFQKKGQLAATGVTANLAMVQELARDVVAQKRPLTDGEKTILDTIDQTILEPNLQTINDDDKANEKALQDAADAVAACESPELDAKIEEASKKDAKAKEEWGKHEACRAEEARLLGERKAAKGRLDDFLSESKAQLPSCAIPTAEADVETVEDFMDKQAAWYAAHDKTYGEKLADWNARIAAHEAKIVECDAQQAVAQQATCEWRTYVLASQAEYDSCRERTLKAYADVLKGNKNMADDYKAEWTAMKHLQCYMITLRGDIDATGDALAHCETEVVDTTHLDVVEPTVAAKAQGKVDGMGNMSKDYGCSA